MTASSMNDTAAPFVVSEARAAVLSAVEAPRWRKIRRFITKHLFGYVNVDDFGVFEEDEDATEGLQAALDYCNRVHTSHTINIGRKLER